MSYEILRQDKKKVVFFEVKRKAKEINLAVLRAKADVFLQTTGQYKDYAISFQGLSMDDMSEKERSGF